MPRKNLFDPEFVIGGIITICMHCNDLRSKDGAWQRVDINPGKRTDAKFSHGICPHCFVTIYGRERQKLGFSC